MSTKDFFDKGTTKVSQIESLESAFDLAGVEIESSEYAQERFTEKARFIPDVDFLSASNFARYGSAEEYYRNSFKRIYQQFPYDGTRSERAKFDNESTYLDKYIFDKVYPRTTGYAIFSPSGWGTLSSPGTTLTGGYGLSDSLEYITVVGGPHTSSAGMIGGKLSKAFGDPTYRTSPNSNVYDTDIYGTEGVKSSERQGTRESNLKFDLSKGISTEFWLNEGSAGCDAETAATAVNCIDLTGVEAAEADCSFTILIPTSAGGLGGTAITFLLDDSATTDSAEGANTIAIGTAGISDAAKAAKLILAINAATDGLIDYASSGNGQAGYDIGVTAAEGSSDTQITLTMDTTGFTGNVENAITTASGVDIVDVRSFTGGLGICHTKQVIFDLWNGAASSSAGYGRLLIGYSGSIDGENPLYAHLASGSSVWDMTFGGSTTTTASLANTWNHVAFTFVSSSINKDLQAKFYLNGELQETTASSHVDDFGEVTGSLIGYIGALQTAPSGNLFDFPHSLTGYGKISGSIDEFRYWKTKRTSKDIGRNWFTQVGGGANDHISNTELGVYYKFNEGVTETTATDSIVLDYSGRLSNGNWVGYESGARNTGSAIVSASAGKTEYLDPIIYLHHPTVQAQLDRLVASGSVWDNKNNSLLYHSFPNFMLEEEDGNDQKHLRNLSQIMASYFDELHLQIESLTDLTSMNYASASAKPAPLASSLLRSKGFLAPEIFSDSSILEIVANRDEDRNFEIELNDVKNQIYKNIYNNLVFINKSKGTEKAFRNLIRCYGVDEELVKINLYSNNSTHTLEDNYRSTSSKKKFLNFAGNSQHSASVYQHSASGNSNTADVTYISGTNRYLANTAEVEVIFPKDVDATAGNENYNPTFFVTSSIFGCHRALTTTDHTWPVDDSDTNAGRLDYNFELYAIRPVQDKPDAYFLLKDRAGNFSLTSSLYGDVYDNQKWNFAVRVKNEKFPIGDFVSGTTNTSASIEFRGINTISDIVVNDFTVTSSVTSSYLTSNRRYYVGSHLLNFSGALSFSSDVRVGSLRHWSSYLDDGVLYAHARDPKNYGSYSPANSTYLTQIALTGTHVPQLETLALNWDFSTITSSDDAGSFTVDDISSGSSGLRSRYPGTFGDIVGNQYTGRAVNFLAGSTKVVTTEYIPSARQRLPEVLGGTDMIRVLSTSDTIYSRDPRPDSYYFTLEKNMYQTISEDMINMFGTIVEFNSLIGSPLNRYRGDYKDLNMLRSLFFERVQNEPNLDKYIEYYRWIDSSLSEMLQQLIPAAANMSEGIFNVVESHILERNKYRSKFPTLKEVVSTEGSAKGFAEQNYSWRIGHAPIAQQATATVTVADGDADSGMTEKESMTITSTDGTSRVYVVIDDNATTVATSAALTTTSDTGAEQAGEKATATWTFTDKPNEATTITLIDYEGTSLVFEVDNDGDGGAGANIEMDPASNNAAGMSAILISKVNASALKITATAGDATGEVLLTQDNAGTAGNKSIALSNYANWNANTTATFPTAFSSGAEVAANSVAVAINTTGTAATQNDFLVQLKAAIESTAGHAGKVTVSAVPTEANGAQTITLTQAQGGLAGNTGAVTTSTGISDDISQTTITQFTGGDDKQNTNSLWWKDRVERDLKGFDTPATIDSQRQDLRSLITSRGSSSAPLVSDDNASYQTSEYAARSLTSLYGISADIAPAVVPGVDDIYNRNKNYYKGAGSFGTSTGLEITDVQSEKDISDMTGTPLELVKKKKRFTVTGENDESLAPFSIYSSSVPSGYVSDLASNFMSSVEITNNHEDVVSVMNEIPMQGPFTEKFVGGSPHRHADINFFSSNKAGKNNLDSAADRIEAYDLDMSTANQLKVMYPDSNRPRSSFYRDETAKRPVSLRNIKQVTGSSPAETKIVSGTLQASIGNFSKVYEVVSAGDRATNNSSFVRAEGFGSSSANSNYFSSMGDRAEPVRPRSEHVIVGKFSAPGDPASSILDLESGQFSPYNDLNTRNLGVRRPLRDLLTERSERFGIRSGSSEVSADYSVPASFHKVNKNSLNRRENINHIAAVVATATITVADGDAASGMAEKETIVITSTDGTEKTYCVIDDNATTVATGAVLAADSDIGSQVAGAALVGAIAVAINLTGSASTQNTFLVQLKAAIEHANGHNGKITVSAVPTEANGAQLITLTQASAGADGNVAITDDISQTTLAGFSDGVDTYIAAEVVSTYDNWFIQHHIPRDDTQYAWIAASYTSSYVYGHAAKDGKYSGSAEGIVPAILFASASSDLVSGIKVDHLGLNTLIYEPLSSSDARIGYPLGTPVASYKNTALGTVPTAQTLNSILLHRRGIYGFSSWITTENHSYNPLVKKWRKENTLAFNTSPGEITVIESGSYEIKQDRYSALQIFTEPPATSRNFPLKFILDVDTGQGDKTAEVKSVFGNQIDNFTNPSIDEALNVSVRDGESYNKIKDLYLYGSLESDNSPIVGFRSLTYKQNVYPQSQNSFLAKTRSRPGFSNNFWRDKRSDRATLGDTKFPLLRTDSGTYSSWNMDAHSAFVSTLTGTTAGILQNDETHYHEGVRNGVSGLTASILFHRKHDVEASASVKSRTGSPVVQTGAAHTTKALMPMGKVPIGAGNAAWQVGSQAGYYDITGTFISSPSYPWYNNYEDYASELRALNKDYSIIPEFRISEHIENYINNRGGDFFSDNPSYLSIEGASSSHPQNSSDDDFYKLYSNSDFMKQFDIIREDHRGFVDPSEIKLTCKAIKRFVPYNGFYPSELLVDMYTRFSASYLDEVRFSGPAGTVANHAGRPRPFIAPLFAPGIWCNTIKSGIAVDWAQYTSSYVVKSPIIAAHTPSTYYLVSTSSAGAEAGFYRIPFEAVVSPESYMANIPLVDMEPHPSCSLNATASWGGDGDNLYKMKAHNALASMIEFFLPGANNKGELATLVSSPESEWKPFKSQKVYGMRVKLRRSYNGTRPLGRDGFTPPHFEDTDIRHGVEETLTICSRPSSFGPPVCGRSGTYGGGPTVHGQGHLWSGSLDSLNGVNPAYTPPYYDGEAWADLLYLHDGNEQPTLEGIQASASLVSWRFDPYILSGSNGGSNHHPYGPNNINNFSMQLTSSINIYGKMRLATIEKDQDGKIVSKTTNTSQKTMVWAIQPKMEVPILNVKDASASISSPTNGSESIPRSIWSQFGKIPTGSTGLYLEVNEIDRSWLKRRVPIFQLEGASGQTPTRLNRDGDLAGNTTVWQENYSLYGGGEVLSLAEHIGFKKRSAKLGQIAQKRTVKEAVIAIPFLESGGKRSFFEIPKEEINASLLDLDPGGKGVTNSVTDMVSKMQDYVFPPKFDFVKNPDIVTPFAMYIFEFKHTFDQDDLSYMWQGIQPNSGKRLQTTEATISHKLLAGELMGEANSQTGEPLQSELRWMVFKVKQKAPTNYYDKVVTHQNSTGETTSTNTSVGRSTSAETDVPEYSYNWPYDYFSLIEFAKIESEIKFAPTEDLRHGASLVITQTTGSC